MPIPEKNVQDLDREIQKQSQILQNPIVIIDENSRKTQDRRVFKSFAKEFGGKFDRIELSRDADNQGFITIALYEENKLVRNRKDHFVHLSRGLREFINNKLSDVQRNAYCALGDAYQSYGEIEEREDFLREAADRKAID